MAKLIVVWWRDIPSQVIVEKGRGRKREQAKVELPKRFIASIDSAAMKAGADQTDDYLADWWRSDPVEVSDDDLQATADAKAAELDAAYPTMRLRELVENEGRAG